MYTVHANQLLLQRLESADGNELCNIRWPFLLKQLQGDFYSLWLYEDQQWVH